MQWDTGAGKGKVSSAALVLSLHEATTDCKLGCSNAVFWGFLCCQATPSLYFVPLLHAFGSGLVLVGIQVTLGTTFCHVANRAAARIAPEDFNAHVVFGHTQWMVRELFLTLQRAHRTILCSSTTLFLATYVAAGWGVLPVII